MAPYFGIVISTRNFKTTRALNDDDDDGPDLCAALLQLQSSVSAPGLERCSDRR